MLGIYSRYLPTLCVRDSASDPAQGLGTATTRRVSVTPPATLLGDGAPLTTRRVSVTQPWIQSLDVETTRKVSATQTRASWSGNRVGSISYGYLEVAKDWYPQGIGVTKTLAECSGIRTDKR